MSPTGCARCLQASDPVAAWDALRTRTLRVLVEDPHFSVQLTQCACGTAFAVVFTEQVDWQRGEDHQSWRALPLTAPEADELSTDASADRLPAHLAALGSARRHLARDFPPGGELQLTWHQGGFIINPHD